jgi:hypothetical protein
LETPQNSKGLIFKNYSKAEKSLFCLFCYFNSTTAIGLNPVALDRAFDKLSKYIKFVENGSVDLDLLNFEVDTSIQNWVQNVFNEFKLNSRAGN